MTAVAADADVAATSPSPSVTDWPTEHQLNDIHPRLRHFLMVSRSLPTLTLPVSARLQNQLSVWKLITSDRWVLELLSVGYKPTFVQKPPLTCNPGWFSVGRGHEQALLTEIDSMLQKGAIEEVSNPASPGFYTSIFLVPKKNGKLRPVINLKPLNQFILTPRFKMLTTRTLAKVLTRGGGTQRHSTCPMRTFTFQ